MAKPRIRLKFISQEYDYESIDSVECYIDGEKVCEGYYGGEPEDNSRMRSYSWVENMLVTMAEKLGHEVEKVQVNLDEEGNEVK